MKRADPGSLVTISGVIVSASFFAVKRNYIDFLCKNFQNNELYATPKKDSY